MPRVAQCEEDHTKLGQVFPGGLTDALAVFRAGTEAALQQRMRQAGVIMAHSLRIILALRVRRRAHREKKTLSRSQDRCGTAGRAAGSSCELPLVGAAPKTSCREQLQACSVTCAVGPTGLSQLSGIVVQWYSTCTVYISLPHLAVCERT